MLNPYAKPFVPYRLDNMQSYFPPPGAVAPCTVQTLPPCSALVDPSEGSRGIAFLCM